jgi:hypothetical protein
MAVGKQREEGARDKVYTLQEGPEWLSSSKWASLLSIHHLPTVPSNYESINGLIHWSCQSPLIRLEPNHLSMIGTQRALSTWALWVILPNQTITNSKYIYLSA